MHKCNHTVQAKTYWSTHLFFSAVTALLQPNASFSAATFATWQQEGQQASTSSHGCGTQRWWRTTHVSTLSASSPGHRSSCPAISARTRTRMMTWIQRRHGPILTSWTSCHLKKSHCGWSWCPSLLGCWCSSSLCSFCGNLASLRERDRTRLFQAILTRMLMVTSLFISLC